MSPPGLTNNPHGRPEFQPTEEQRKMVQILVGMAVPTTVIARNLTVGGIDHRTLKKHFAEELENGRETLVASLKAQIVKAAQNGSVRAQTWLLERLGGPEFAPKMRLSRDDEALAQATQIAPETQVSIYLPDNGRGIRDAEVIEGKAE